jgi:hypothetical protein
MSGYRTLVSLGVVVLLVGLASLVATGAIGRAPPPGPTPTVRPGGTGGGEPFPTPTVTPAPPSLDLSGTWTGRYTGQINGTFTVAWTQTADALDGTIMLSSPLATLHVIGDLTGITILFVAVGMVTYSGTVSGSTMSGSFATANGKTGSWTATIFP